MKIVNALALSALTFSGTSFAWTWRWTDAEEKSHIEFGKGDLNCTIIAMPKGAEYNWDPEGSFYCIHTFSDSKCTDRNGWSCNLWPNRKLSQPWVRAYEVNTIDGYGNERSNREATSTRTEEPTEATSESTSTSTESVSKSASNTATRAPSATESAAASSGGSSLSGGAIAGIVVGVCAGVGVMAIFGFLAYRRQRPAGSSRVQSGSFVNEVDGASPPPPPPKNAYPELDSTPATPVAQPPPPMPAASTQPAVSELSAESAPPCPREKGAPATVPYMTAKMRIAELPDNSQEGKNWH